MKKTLTLCLWRCTLAMGLIACHKDHNTPIPPTPPVQGKLNINTAYPDSTRTLTNVELIITEPGGKLLLDTIVPVNTQLTATPPYRRHPGERHHSGLQSQLYAV